MPKNAQSIRPFLKWAGSKFRIIDRIQRLLPPGKRLIEPFTGSGAVFLNTDYDHYLLSDNNPDLINLYRYLQEDGQAFIDYCKNYYFGDKFNNPDTYYKRRELFNKTTDLRKKSALFLYLNRHGYNGLCRYNSSGGFNVPFGRYKHPYFPAKEMLAFHYKSQYAEFRVAGFETVMQNAKRGDVIYCDPPYHPLSASANFTTYSAGGFSEAQQHQLAALAKAARERNIPVLISNHNTRFTLDVYADATLENFPVRRFISCNGNRRDHAGELLALYS
ncbi:MAG: Dam family site-specific DNA-(adenine-N6)-methyltransferase [Gammaproteobacteria bacterium]|nr:Dam family site-specific DNA-(adenine-N6)-methyltransferase [Gammaproteobacteria bacterium]MDH5651441.1 Dam family site-specific DNA-(adenine-N6)-methyltransferase [Gammaproteobacteria bacterium]